MEGYWVNPGASLFVSNHIDRKTTAQDVFVPGNMINCRRICRGTYEFQLVAIAQQSGSVYNKNVHVCSDIAPVILYQLRACFCIGRGMFLRQSLTGRISAKTFVGRLLVAPQVL